MEEIKIDLTSLTGPSLSLNHLYQEMEQKGLVITTLSFKLKS